MRSEIFYNHLHPIKGREPARIDFTTGYCWMPFSETESYKVTTVNDKWHWIAKDGSIGPVAVPYELPVPAAVEDQGNWKTRLGVPVEEDQARLISHQNWVQEKHAKGCQSAGSALGGMRLPCNCGATTPVEEQGNWKTRLGEQENQGASVDDTIRDRGKTYGDFKDVAATTLKLKLVMLEADPVFSAEQAEALAMICTKIARLLHGDPNDVNSWHDIAGYATLAERSCRK